MSMTQIPELSSKSRSGHIFYITLGYPLGIFQNIPSSTFNNMAHIKPYGEYNFVETNNFDKVTIWYFCTCACMCMCMRMHVEVRSQPSVSFLRRFLLVL